MSIIFYNYDLLFYIMCYLNVRDCAIFSNSSNRRIKEYMDTFFRSYISDDLIIDRYTVDRSRFKRKAENDFIIKDDYSAVYRWLSLKQHKIKNLTLVNNDQVIEYAMQFGDGIKRLVIDNMVSEDISNRVLDRCPNLNLIFFCNPKSDAQVIRIIDDFPNLTALVIKNCNMTRSCMQIHRLKRLKYLKLEYAGIVPIQAVIRILHYCKDIERIMISHATGADFRKLIGSKITHIIMIFWTQCIPTLGSLYKLLETNSRVKINIAMKITNHDQSSHNVIRMLSRFLSVTIEPNNMVKFIR